MHCSKCQKKIPAARMRALPNTKTCVECSDVERNYVRTIISGKTTYSEWEVIKNKDTKEYLQKLDSKGRQGFGSMLYRASRNEPNPKASELSKNVRVARKMPEFTKEAFESVLKEAMDWIDTDKDYAINKMKGYAKSPRYIRGRRIGYATAGTGAGIVGLDALIGGEREKREEEAMYR